MSNQVANKVLEVMKSPEFELEIHNRVNKEDNFDKDVLKSSSNNETPVKSTARVNIYPDVQKYYENRERRIVLGDLRAGVYISVLFACKCTRTIEKIYPNEAD